MSKNPELLAPRKRICYSCGIDKIEKNRKFRLLFHDYGLITKFGKSYERYLNLQEPLDFKNDSSVVCDVCVRLHNKWYETVTNTNKNRMEFRRRFRNGKSLEETDANMQTQVGKTVCSEPNESLAIKKRNSIEKCVLKLRSDFAKTETTSVGEESTLGTVGSYNSGNVIQKA